MALKFYTDVHISRKAVEQLRAKQVDIIHCVEVGMEDAEDSEHLEYATENQRVMVSCDEDFELLYIECINTGRQHASILYFQMGPKCKSIGHLVKTILFYHEAAAEGDALNQFWRV